MVSVDHLELLAPRLEIPAYGPLGASTISKPKTTFDSSCTRAASVWNSSSTTERIDDAPQSRFSLSMVSAQMFGTQGHILSGEVVALVLILHLGIEPDEDIDTSYQVAVDRLIE